MKILVLFQKFDLFFFLKSTILTLFWIAWNIFVICVYLNIGILDRVIIFIYKYFLHFFNTECPAKAEQVEKYSSVSKYFDAFRALIFNLFFKSLLMFKTR